jgi:hypothetical protein
VSFKCDGCGETQGLHVKPEKVVVEKRPVSYLNRKIDPETEKVTEFVTEGWEIAKELNLCPACVKKAR